MTTETTNQANSGSTAEVKKAEVKPAKKNIPYHQLQHNHRSGKFGASSNKGGKSMGGFSTRRSGSGGDR